MQLKKIARNNTFTTTYHIDSNEPHGLLRHSYMATLKYALPVQFAQLASTISIFDLFLFLPIRRTIIELLYTVWCQAFSY